MSKSKVLQMNQLCNINFNFYLHGLCQGQLGQQIQTGYQGPRLLRPKVGFPDRGLRLWQWQASAFDHRTIELLVRLKKKYQMMIIFAEKSSKKSEKSKFVKKIHQKILIKKLVKKIVNWQWQASAFDHMTIELLVRLKKKRIKLLHIFAKKSS